MYVMFKMKKQKGFTLIELLIVIVLLGILAAVLVSVISPDKQQSQANDGTIRAMMNKMILSTSSFDSSYGRVPTEADFFGSLEMKAVELNGTECTVAGAPDYECLFTITGINLPATCDASGWTNTSGMPGTEPCNFRYQGRIENDPARYRLYVKSSGIADAVFAFDSRRGGKVYECPQTITDSDDLRTECN